MTTTQKLYFTAAAAVGLGIAAYEACRASRLESESQSLREQVGSLTRQVQQLVRERDKAAKEVTGAQRRIEQLRRDTAELPKLRSEVTRLGEEARQLAQFKTAKAQATMNPKMEAALTSWAARVGELWQRQEQMPDKKIPELQLCDGYDWLEAAKNAQLDSDAAVRRALSRLRQLGKERFAALMEGALDKYVAANNGRLPTDPAELKAYCETAVDDAVFSRYTMLHTGKLSDLPPATLWLMAERSPADNEYDSRVKIGMGTYTVIPVGPGEVDENGEPAYRDQP